MTAQTKSPERKPTGVLARLFFGALVPAVIYGAVLSRLVPWWGGAPEYKGWDNVLVFLAGLVTLLFNCWVTFVSWKTIPNAFFAGMIAPCLALSFDGYTSDSRYEHYRLTALAVPLSTATLFVIYQVSIRVTASLRCRGILQPYDAERTLSRRLTRAITGGEPRRLPFIAYLVLIAYAAVLTASEIGQPTSGSLLWTLIVAGVAALPWSLGLLFAIEGPLGGALTYGGLWLGIALNTVVLWYLRWGGSTPTQHDPEGR